VKDSSEKAFHCTLEYLDPFSKMRVGRTYLLSPNVKNDQHVKEVIDTEISVYGDKLVGYALNYEENLQFPDEDFLINIYNSLCNQFLEII
jgi:hypothetical protein